MKRLIFLTIGTKGDLYPFLGMAIEMQRRGYRPLILTSETHRADCEAAGCEFESIQPHKNYVAMLEHPDIFKPIHGLRVYLKEGIAATTRAAYERIEFHAQREPCALVCNNLMFAGQIAHEKLGLPLTSVFLHPFSHMSYTDPPKDKPFNTMFLTAIGRTARVGVVRLFHALYNADLSGVQQLRQSLGLPPVKNMMGQGRYTAPLMLDLWPEWYCPAKPDWPGRTERTGFIEYDGPGSECRQLPPEILRFLERKPVLFTLGSAVLKGHAERLGLFIEVCRSLRRPGLLVGQAQRPEMPSSDFMVTGPLPFAKIFPYASLVLSHGGIGTVARAIAAGKPQVILPEVNDQFDNAHQIQRLQLGLALTSELSANRLMEAITAAESPKIIATCQQRQLDLAENPGLKLTCDRIESVASGAEAPRPQSRPTRS